MPRMLRHTGTPRPSVSTAKPALSTLALGLVAGTASMALAAAILACAGSLAGAAEPTGTAIPPAEVATRLSQRGYAVTEPVIRRGGAYLTHGTDRHGQRLRLVMDARNGEIIGLRVIGDGRPARREVPARP